MAIAIALLLIVVATVVFHVVTPWWSTPLASNWGAMDDTMTITVVVTGIFFVVINLFVVYTLWRFRHRRDARAAYEPENKRLERWLIGITTIGIVATAGAGPGGLRALRRSAARAPRSSRCWRQQWQWRFRLPGADGALGGSDVRFVSGDNPFGLDPSDPEGAGRRARRRQRSPPAARPTGQGVDALARRAARLFRAELSRAHEHRAGPGQLVLVHADACRGASRRCVPSCAASGIRRCAALSWSTTPPPTRPGCGSSRPSR